MSETREMTKTEREELKRLARERARVAKRDAERRTADLMASFERQVVTVYDFDRDEVWKAAVEAAQEAVDKAQEQIMERCGELGIPRELAPRFSAHWAGGGERAVRQRQGDLRRAAQKQIEAMERTAKHEIDRKALEVQTELVSEGLTSGRAIEFLQAMPTVESLMPELDVGALDADTPQIGGGEF